MRKENAAMQRECRGERQTCVLATMVNSACEPTSGTRDSAIRLARRSESLRALG